MFVIKWHLLLDLYYCSLHLWHEDLSKAIVFKSMDAAKEAYDRLIKERPELQHFICIQIIGVD